MRIATLFSGGEGVGVGAERAGIKHLWGIEYDNDIAQVARDNGFNTITANVLDIDARTLEAPDILHASPVCTNASVANADGEEAQLDIDTATKTGEFITALKPRFFTLENVYPYRKFKSFKIITDTLTSVGYSWSYWHLNSADYGVPQIRRRLILIAKLGYGQHISIPKPTHHNPANYDDNQFMMFAPDTLPWVGWYEAIEDLIPTLPESEFAPWQLKRLPDEIKNSVMSVVNGGNSDYLEDDEPAQTVTTPTGGRNARALLVNSAFPQSNGKKHFTTEEPAYTVDTQGLSRTRAFIASGALNDNSTSLTTRDGHNPIMTIITSHNQRDMKGRINGCVVKMTPRALARFQSFPDSYKLPNKNSLAVKVIGNAVPPELYAQIVKAL